MLVNILMMWCGLKKFGAAEPLWFRSIYHVHLCIYFILFEFTLITNCDGCITQCENVAEFEKHLLVQAH